MKCRIQIRLITQYQMMLSPFDEPIRKEGDDYWKITLTYQDSEGQSGVRFYTSHDKSKALTKAYEHIEKLTVDEWFPIFYANMLAKYYDIISVKEKGVDRFKESINKVKNGEYSREGFQRVWDHRRVLSEGSIEKPVCAVAEPTPNKSWWEFWK